ncbi:MULTISPECIES: S-layer family protein [unclassified Moorena]|uniref:S-layer family protein n=1 Tax=unclassified Moorena TaxID=2683338 RepID=UPI0013FEC5AE|nr:MULTISPECIES: S-layer family protein [unclassified Moorena]NEO12700.1 S-layer family protein [Moorena sp. SIO3E8]NEQ04039.1 S-layer family protein [Moorena sp. SIO3F7]
MTIKAKGIFGLEFRDRLTPDNDITATSELGPSFSGEVILNTPDVDPTSGLTELPGSPVDAEAILANDLCGFENNRIAGGSSFTISGKGGLPASADDPVINTDRTVGWLSRPGLASSRQALQKQPKAFGHATRTVRPPQDKKVIIEALGWVIAKDGTIILTAQPFRGTPVEQILPNLDCHAGVGSRESGVGSRESGIGNSGSGNRESGVWGGGTLSRVCFLDLGIRLGITQQKYILKPKPQEGFEYSIKIIK